MINLISDTVTKPSRAMLQAMIAAEVGDDVFGEDPTVNKLEEKMARMFNHEAALFCPSGTMTNQLAIKCHTQPLDEMICDISSHVYQYETAGYAYHSGIGVNLLDGEYGKITPDMIHLAVKPNFDWLPNSKLVVIENSCNRGGGSYYDHGEMAAIRDICNQHHLKLHLDGARLFNVLVETKDDPAEIGDLFDSISICLSKGLGAPVGSVLIGPVNFINKARHFRKVFGGGMRQSGILAAAGIHALDYNRERLKVDNDRAKTLGGALSALGYVDNVRPVKTNIVIFDLIKTVEPERFLDYLKQHEVLATAFGAQSIRLVTHLDLDEGMISKVIEVLKSFEEAVN